jgi:hypothetical protein
VIRKLAILGLKLEPSKVANSMKAHIDRHDAVSIKGGFLHVDFVQYS